MSNQIMSNPGFVSHKKIPRIPSNLNGVVSMKKPSFVDQAEGLKYLAEFRWFHGI